MPCNVCYTVSTVMDWIAFCYSLPSKEGSSPRVALWRRLRRLGALPIAGGVQILPARDECIEAFQWLSQEMRTTNGEAVVMRVTRFEGLTDQQVVALFFAARVEDYRHIETNAADLRQSLADRKGTVVPQARDVLARLRKRHADIARIDYFECPEGRRVALLLDDIERSLSASVPASPPIPHADITQYRDKRWVTRPHPHVDRVACAWLIRHFVNAQAAIRYSSQADKDEVAFDMNEGEFGHQGSLCTFETMKLAFGLENPELQPIAEIVHEIDLHDDRYIWPETAGIERLLNGWALVGLSDGELESKGVSLFEGLYAAFSRSP
jgi:hypothetical protein